MLLLLRLAFQLSFLQLLLLFPSPSLSLLRFFFLKKKLRRGGAQRRHSGGRTRSQSRSPAAALRRCAALRTHTRCCPLSSFARLNAPNLIIPSPSLFLSLSPPLSSPPLPHTHRQQPPPPPPSLPSPPHARTMAISELGWPDEVRVPAAPLPLSVSAARRRVTARSRPPARLSATDAPALALPLACCRMRAIWGGRGDDGGSGRIARQGVCRLGFAPGLLAWEGWAWARRPPRPASASRRRRRRPRRRRRKVGTAAAADADAAAGPLPLSLSPRFRCCLLHIRPLVSSGGWFVTWCCCLLLAAAALGIDSFCCWLCAQRRSASTRSCGTRAPARSSASPPSAPASSTSRRDTASRWVI
jgi:hypothetical protein